MNVFHHHAQSCGQVSYLSQASHTKFPHEMLQSCGQSVLFSQFSQIQFQQEFDCCCFDITNCIVFDAAQCLEVFARYGVIFRFIVVSYGTSLNLKEVVSDRSFHDKVVPSIRHSIR